MSIATVVMKQQFNNIFVKIPPFLISAVIEESECFYAEKSIS